jgi:site-specific recombinase XerD
MGKRLDRVDVRGRLELRRDPYWQRISEGRYIGFRKMTKGSEGTWLARVYVDCKYAHRSLGDFSELPDGDRYDAALREANKWFDHLDLGGSTKPGTVRAACEAYLETLQNERGDAAKQNADGFFKRLVYDDPIAEVDLAKLNKEHVTTWRKKVLKDSTEKSSFNRNITSLRAALNLAHEEGKIATDQAWIKALKPLKNVDNRRTLYLERGERKKLVEGASDEAKPLFKTLNLLPMRPGEVANLRVEYLKASQRALEIPTGKTEPRIIPLTDEMVSHFKQCASGKLPKAWLVSRADGGQWDRFAWRDEMKLAAAAAHLPPATVAYTLRHSVITDLVVGGLDIFTVAKLAGTSVAMIQKHYGHLQNDHARSHLEKLANA